MGTVFAFHPNTGTESVVYSFAGGTDAANPGAGLARVGSLLYGTTGSGGRFGSGTVFALNTSTGKESVVFSFGSGNEGKYPFASLLPYGGALYGTTSGGGTYGYGAVFSLNLETGGVSALYDFKGGADGAFSGAALIDVLGILYGTSVGGGGTGCDYHGCGTVFAINPANGAEHVVCALASDSQAPAARLTQVGGKLYGTAQFNDSTGDGAVFVVNRITGAETVLHVFSGGSDGVNPLAGLIDVGGTLFGTTSAGGAGNLGTVFAITP